MQQARQTPCPYTTSRESLCEREGGTVAPSILLWSLSLSLSLSVSSLSTYLTGTRPWLCLWHLSLFHLRLCKRAITVLGELYWVVEIQSTCFTLFKIMYGLQTLHVTVMTIMYLCVFLCLQCKLTSLGCFFFCPPLSQT